MEVVRRDGALVELRAPDVDAVHTVAGRADRAEVTADPGRVGRVDAGLRVGCRAGAGGEGHRQAKPAAADVGAGEAEAGEVGAVVAAGRSRRAGGEVYLDGEAVAVAAVEPDEGVVPAGGLQVIAHRVGGGDAERRAVAPERAVRQADRRDQLVGGQRAVRREGGVRHDGRVRLAPHAGLGQVLAVRVQVLGQREAGAAGAVEQLHEAAGDDRGGVSYAHSPYLPLTALKFCSTSAEDSALPYMRWTAMLHLA